MLDKLIRRYHGNNIEDLYVVVGASQVLPSTIVTALKDVIEEEKKAKINEDNKASLLEAEKMIDAQRKKEKAKKKSYFGRRGFRHEQCTGQIREMLQSGTGR